MNSPICATAFWHFSCDLYALSGVQDALLCAQNQDAKNVNILLLLRYLETLHLQLEQQQLDTLKQCTQEFDRLFLAPHRLIRANFKATYSLHPTYSTVRKSLLNSELLLEKLQQTLLIQQLEQTKLQTNPMANNLALYTDSLTLIALLRQS
ncbi:TIGR02444 family protein [Pseudoalteromonas xiamenensis]